MEDEADDAPAWVLNKATVTGETTLLQAGTIHGSVFHGDVNVHLSVLRPIIPRQLPAHPKVFVGRENELRLLDSLAAQDFDANAPVVISAIGGTAGVGKTALALYWAHRVSDRFPDGQLYVNLRGFDPGSQQLPAGHVIRGFLDAFGIPPDRVPASPEAQAGLYRSILADQRILILLDNARDANHVRPLLPGSASSIAVVTSRDKMSSLIVHEGAHSISLDILDRAEAVQLLTSRIGTGTGNTALLNGLADQCGGLPLALSIVAARIVESPSHALTDLLDELKDEKTRLDALDGGDSSTDIRTVFSSSLNGLSPAGARLFSALGVHPGPDFTIAAASTLTGSPVAESRAAMLELVRASLINEHQQGRFLCHDLVRAWSRDRSQTDFTAAERDTMTKRLLDHHLQAAREAALKLDPFREDISPTAPSSPVVVFADYAQAFAWFDAEHPVLIALMVEAAATGFEAYVWRLAWALTDFLDRRGHWQHLVRIQELALAVARDLHDREGSAHTSRNLGHAHARLRSYDQAREHFLNAIDLFRGMSNRSGEAAVQLNVAWVFELQEHYDTALAHATRSLELYEELADRAGIGRAANAVGWYQTLRGQHEQAVVQCRRALEVLSALGVRHDEAYTLESLGHAHHHLGQLDESIECYSRSLELLRDLGDSYYEAVVLRRLAATYLAANDESTASSLRAQALSILDRLGHPDADGLRAELSSPP